MIQRTIGEDDPETKEYAVRFAGEQRSWFLAEDLVKSPPDKLVRFFRSEVTERWKQLDPSGVAVLNVDRAELVMLLQEDCGFARRRAEAEVDEFFSSVLFQTATCDRFPGKSEPVCCLMK